MVAVTMIGVGAIMAAGVAAITTEEITIAAAATMIGVATMIAAVGTMTVAAETTIARVIAMGKGGTSFCVQACFSWSIIRPTDTF